jgi:hypothetical protein
MFGHIQIYEQSYPNAQYSTTNIILTMNKENLKSTCISFNNQQIESIIVIGSFVIPLKIAKKIMNTKYTSLYAKISDGCLTIIGDDNEIYTNTLGINILLNVEKTKISLLH